MALGKFKLALRDFESVKKAKPRDPDAQVHYIYIRTATNSSFGIPILA